MQKFGKGDIRGIQSHNQREKESRTNPDIDNEKSKGNYDLLHKRNINFHQVIKKRIDCLNLNKAIRKDAVVMCGFIVTSDSSFFEKLSPNQQKQFFQDSLDFFSQRYGKENIVNATVHVDEKTPHMHLGLVPITSDGRLSAKSLFGRKELHSIQTDFVKAVGSQYGLERGKEGSEAEHIITSRYKAQEASRETSRLAQEAAKQASYLEAQGKKANDLYGQISTLQGAFHNINDIPKGKSSILGNISFTKQEASDLIKTAEAYWGEKAKADAWKQRATSAETKVKEIYDSAGAKENQRLREQNKELLGDNSKLKNIITQQDRELERVENVFENRPDIEEQFLNAEESLNKTRSYDKGIGR